jgi:hypothetical protein
MQNILFQRAYRELVNIVLEDALQIELLEFSLEPTGKTGVHGGASGEDYVLVQF